MSVRAIGAMPRLTSSEFEDHAPVFRQIALILRERIGAVWRAGDELPSEGALAIEFRVNRNTLRRAIGLLVDEGVLDRHRGIKLRVARLPGLERPKLEADPTQLFRMRPGTEFKVLAFNTVPLPTDAAASLGLEPGTEACRIERFLMAGSDVLAYLIVHVPVDIGAKLRKLDLRHHTVTALLYANLGVHTRRIQQTIEATLADANIAAALGMAPGTAALRCGYVITDEHDRPVQAAAHTSIPAIDFGSRWKFRLRRLENCGHKAHGGLAACGHSEPGGSKVSCAPRQRDWGSRSSRGDHARRQFVESCYVSFIQPFFRTIALDKISPTQLCIAAWGLHKVVRQAGRAWINQQAPPNWVHLPRPAIQTSSLRTAYGTPQHSLADRQQLKCLTVLDECTCGSLALDVSGSLRSTRVIEVLG